MDDKNLLIAIAKIGLDKQASSLEIIDISGKVDYADFLVVCSGKSERQVRAIAEGIETELKRKGVAALGIEGMQQARWVLMDYANVVVHVLHRDARDYYDIEGLWMDAQRLPLEVEETAS